MDMQTYEIRAIPRLTRIDEITPRCAWDKHDCQCTAEELRARDLWRGLMSQQNDDEIAAGL